MLIYSLATYDSSLAMIDNLGGTDRVNNLLPALNMKPMNAKNLKAIERRAGQFIEKVSKMSADKAAKESFQLEME